MNEIAIRQPTEVIAVEILPPADRAVRKWGALINACWSGVRDNVIGTGRLLNEAKAKLKHGQWLALLGNKQQRGEVAFSYRTATRLMRIALDTRISNRTHVSYLPTGWGTLYELTRLTDEEFESGIADGWIRPDLERHEIATYIRRLKKEKDEARILSLKPAKGRVRTIIIDPPWDHGGFSLAGRGEPTYALMSQEQLLALPFGSAWADEKCHLYLWTTNNFILRAGALIEPWGFQFKTVLTWVKPHFGLGSYFRSSTEQVLFATRGDLGTRVSDIPTHFEAPAAEHSAKPEKFYDIVRRASYPPYGEAFQITPRKGIAQLFIETKP